MYIHVYIINNTIRNEKLRDIKKYARNPSRRISKLISNYLEETEHFSFCFYDNISV